MLTTLKEILIGLMLTHFSPTSSTELSEIKLTALSLPINHVHEQNFIIQIPSHFISLQTLEQAEEQGFFQFVCLNDDKKGWSQKITIHTFKNIQNMIETNFMSFEKLKFLQNPDTKVIEESTEIFDFYAKSTLSILYQEQGYPILVHMVYYFGSRDLAGVQFTQVLSAQENVDEALLALKGVIENYTKIIH